MDFVTELESRVARYREEATSLRNRLAHLDALISHGAALIDEESRQSQLPLAIESRKNNAVNHPNGSVPQSVSQAMYILLVKGPAKYSDMVRHIQVEYPAIQVKNVPKSLSSALRNGKQQGRVQRLKRGVYALNN